MIANHSEARIEGKPGRITKVLVGVIALLFFAIFFQLLFIMNDLIGIQVAQGQFQEEYLVLMDERAS